MTDIDVVVEVAFDSGWTTPAASRTWTDISDHVERQDGIGITHGRSDERSVCDPNGLTLAVDNTDGRFTPGNASSPYYPNVKIGRPIRVTATPDGGSASVRYVGYVDQWPIQWPGGSDAYTTSRITASSRLARLGGPNLPTTAQLAALELSPDALWPLTEATGATQGLDASGNDGPAMIAYPLDGGTNVTPLFGAGASAPSDSLPSVGLPNGGNGLRAYGAACSAAAQAWSAALLFNLGPVEGVSSVNLFVLRNAANTDFVLVQVSNGVVTVFVSIAGSATVEASISVNLMDGESHVVGLSCGSGGTPNLSTYFDGALVSTASLSPFPTSVLSDIQLGGYFDSGAGAAEFASVGRVGFWRGTILNATQHGDLSEAILTGYLDEAPGDRFERYAGYASIPATEVSADTGISPMDHVNTDGTNPLALLRMVEATDGGVMFDAKDGTLTYSGRDDRYLAASDFTLDFDLGQVEADFAPTYDRTGMQNDVTADMANGRATVRAFDQTSIDDYGPAGDSLSLATTDVNEPHAAAWWQVNTSAEPRLRVPSLSVDLLPCSLALQTSILAATVGTRFAVSNQPPQVSPTGDHFVEGWTETIGVGSYRFTFNVSDATAYVNTFVLEDATRGELDSTYVIAH